MKKIICIGECGLDIIFKDREPIGSVPGGRIVNAAAMLARYGGMPVIMASEIAADPVGDIVADYLASAGVDMKSVDRYTEGNTPVQVYIQHADGTTGVTRYENYPDDCFDIIWPRIDEGDIVVFGGFYALDTRMRQRMTQLLAHASQRKAVMVYLPGFPSDRESRITRVMPAILENLEYANLVITRSSDMTDIFGTEQGDACYHNHIDFYCRSLINIDTACHRISYYSGKEVTDTPIPADTCSTLLWNAGAVAGIVAALYACDVKAEDLDTPPEELRCKVITGAAKSAREAAAAITAEWQKNH
ncbi:MAG: PfkB family carbohydrate kinase [Muribaculaceae bacterium]